MKSNKDKEFQEKFPFISCIKINDDEYVGIVINYDSNVTSIYDFSIIRTELEKTSFLELGEAWWWESNRKIPINIFLKAEMSIFRPYIKTFNSKDLSIVFGPTVNLSEIAEKRIKRKSIQLVRSPRRTRS
jgi:hypothetical protein